MRHVRHKPGMVEITHNDVQIPFKSPHAYSGQWISMTSCWFVSGIFSLRFNSHLLNLMIVCTYAQHDKIPREVRIANSASTNHAVSSLLPCNAIVGLPHKTLGNSIFTVQPVQIVCSLHSYRTWSIRCRSRIVAAPPDVLNK